MRALGGLIGKDAASAYAPTDDDIQKNVLAALAQTAWAPRAGIKITVADGVVTLKGAITDD
jgi:osmotically-inducible protein OsmY